MLRSVLSHRAAIILAITILVPSPQLNAADVNCFPDDTELVVAVNLKQILSSEMVKSQPDALNELKEVLGQFAGLQTVQKYLGEAGVDAFRDLRSITYVYTGNKDPKVSFLILEGEFNAGTLKDAAKVRGAELRAKTTGDTTVYEITPRGEKQFHAALVNASTLIAAADGEAIADALARVAGSKKSGLKKELRKWLESADERQSVTFVSSGVAFARLVEGVSIPNTEPAIAFLKTLSAFSGGLTLAKGIQFQVAFNAESEEAAKKLTDSANSGLRLLLTLVQATAEKDRKYLPVVDVVKSLRFTSRSGGILFRGEVTLDTVEKLITAFPVDRPAKDRK